MPPEDEIEVRSVEMPEGTADLFDVGPVYVPPVDPEPTPEPPVPVAEVPAPSDVSPSLPDWLSSDPAERRTQLEAALESLPVEERFSLQPVQDALLQTRSATANQTRQQTIAELAQQQADNNLETVATDFTTAVGAWLPDEAGIDLPEAVNRVIEGAQANYHTSLAQDVQSGIAGVLNQLGVQQLPPELLQAVDQAPSFGGVVQTYMNFAAQVGYQAGIGKGGMDANKRTDADRIADKVRLTNEIKAQLVKDGWKQPIAPNLSGSAPMTADGDLSDEELKYAMSSDSAYAEVMNGPKGDQYRKLFAEAIGQNG